MTLKPRTDGSEIKYLLPSEIQTEDIYNVRPANSDDSKAVEQLAKDIEENGQLDAAIVYPRQRKLTKEEKEDPTLESFDSEELVLVSGHRRRQALNLINERNSTLGKPLLKLRVVVDREAKSEDERLRKAISSNLQRKNFSPMDLALLIKQLKLKFGWKGSQGSKLLANWLNVSTATIIQHEKFLGDGVSVEVKDKLVSGELSAQSALEIISAAPDEPEKQAVIVEKAVKVQKETKADKTEEKKPAKDKAAKPAKEPKPVKEPSKRIESPAVRQAIRETANTDATPPRTRKEILEFFSDVLESPLYGYPDGPVKQFCGYLLNKYAPGKGTDATLTTKFDAMVEKAAKGTKESLPAEKKTEAVAKKKTPAKSKAA